MTELCVILDQLLHSDQVFNRQDVARTTSFSTQDEVTKPLIERNNRADKHAKREEKYSDVAPQDARPDCDSNKTESLAIEGDLYDYALKYRRDKMESILHPKPFSSEFRSGTLILVGQACLVSKAAEGVAVICQKLTKDLNRVIFKLSEGINREAFTREAESRVAVPNRTLLLNNGSDNTFTLYGPRDKVEEVREGLKYLESQLLGSPESRVLARPKSGSVTPNFQADQRKLTLFPEQVEPRRGFYAGPANGSKMEPKQPSTFVKVEPKREPTEPVYQQRPYGEASNNAIHPRTPGNQIAVSVLKGDLREQRTNVIVNPSNTQLLHRAGAAKAIADAAGPRLVYECEDYIRGHGELKTGQVMHTTAGNLSPQIQYVIHAAGPSASAYPEKRDLARKLEETFFNCLKYANDKLRVKSIAIPAISSGNFYLLLDRIAPIFSSVLAGSLTLCIVWVMVTDCPSIHESIYPFINQSIHESILSSIHQSVHPLIHPSFHYQIIPCVLLNGNLFGVTCCIAFTFAVHITPSFTLQPPCGSPCE